MLDICANNVNNGPGWVSGTWLKVFGFFTNSQNLEILAFLYCGEFVKNPIDKIDKHFLGQILLKVPTQSRTHFETMYWLPLEGDFYQCKCQSKFWPIFISNNSWQYIYIFLAILAIFGPFRPLYVYLFRGLRFETQGRRHQKSKTGVTMASQNVPMSFKIYNKYRGPLTHLLSGEAINLAYMPVLVPVGVIGNILSFLVSIDSLFWIIAVYLKLIHQ